MPLRKGDWKEFQFPDYEGRGVLNLLASIVRARGGHSPHAELEGLPARELTAPRIIYLVVDGLGAEQTERHIARGGGKAFLGAMPRKTISTVFPATTAAAITTLTTGASPSEHGILGWFLHLHDLGLVSTILPATTRMGLPMADEGFSLREYLRIPSYVDSVPCRTALLSHGPIPRSRYSMAGTQWRERTSFTTLRGMERQVLAFARGKEPGLAHAYWPSYDSLCHELGTGHPAVAAHLEDVDATLARISAGLRDTGAVMVVTADHGLVDAPRSCRIDLASIPGLYDCLAALPSGDPRCVHCFVRPARVKRFLAIVEERIGDACVCVSGEELIAAGAFGPGTPHPALASRVGDHVLLARGNHAFASSPAGYRQHPKLGNHGGMSATEVLVPLYVVGG